MENLNDHWTSVLYDRQAKRFRPLGMYDNKAYCHRAPEERGGKIFVGHPFTVDRPELWVTAVQTRDHELTVQLHNPTDGKIATAVHRSPFFDFLPCADFNVEIPAGATLDYRITPSGFAPVAALTPPSAPAVSSRSAAPASGTGDT